MAEIHVGTMGWTYKDWVGSFYPGEMGQDNFLDFYCQVFSALEIDSTFYFIPKPSVVSNWYARTPSDFVFTAKMPKLITHERHLMDCDELAENFMVSIGLLGKKLGCVLIQLPISFRQNHGTFDRVADFLAQLPTDDFRFAVEFRHPSWISAEVFTLLGQQSVAWAIQDSIGEMPICPQLTTNFSYIRWIGDSIDERIDHVGAPVVDRSHDLIRWSDRIKRDILPEVNALFCMFNNHYEGHAPSSCNQMKRLLGLEAVDPDIGHQMSLF